MQKKSSVSKVIRETIHQLNVTMKALRWAYKVRTKNFLNKEGQPARFVFLYFFKLPRIMVTEEASRNQKYCLFSVNFWACFFLSIFKIFEV